MLGLERSETPGTSPACETQKNTHEDQADDRSLTWILWRRTNMIFHCFPHDCPPPLHWYWYCWFRAGVLFTHYSLSRLPASHPQTLMSSSEHNLRLCQQLGVTDFKAQDMNNQSVIFSFSSSCYWPAFMIFSPPSLHHPSFPLPCSAPPFSLPLSLSPLHLWPSLCRLLICTGGSSRFRIRGIKPSQKTTTDRLVISRK